MSGAEAFIHRFIPGQKSKRTLLVLHGTGGNEDDLLPVGRMIDSDSALLSPRGKVLENGASRFFRRLREGVFDEEDVIRRANELADFVTAAVKEEWSGYVADYRCRLLEWSEHRVRDDAAASGNPSRRGALSRPAPTDSSPVPGSHGKGSIFVFRKIRSHRRCR